MRVSRLRGVDEDSGNSENDNGCKSITMIMTKAKIKISNDGIQQKMRTCSYTRHRKDKKAKIKIYDDEIQGN